MGSLQGQQVWWACAVFVVALEKQLQGGSMDATTTAGQSGADGLKLALVLEVRTPLDPHRVMCES